MNKKELALKVYEALTKEYPSARCTLEQRNPEYFLFANILSPQCTDIVANRVAGKLWDTFGNAEGIADTSIADIENVIRPCGMYRVKGKNIHASAQLLQKKFKGKLPNTLNELTEFPGIGRKTAMVILQEVYGKVEGIIVDTHNIRIANRVGLTKEKDAVKIENDLMKVVSKKYWGKWSHLMVFHGRELCIGRNPKCDRCPINKICAYYNES